MYMYKNVRNEKLWETLKVKERDNVSAVFYLILKLSEHNIEIE